jgi:YD repeat-containing protein
VRNEQVKNEEAMNISLLISTCIAGLISVLSAASAYADGANEPIPSFYEEPGISRNRDYVNQHANEHIDPFTGKLQLHYVDLFIPGNGGLDLKVQRSYTSLGQAAPAFTSVGLGWTMHFGRVLRGANLDVCDTINFDARRNPVLELPDGGRHILYIASDGSTFISPGLWKATCMPGGLAVFSPDGIRYDMTEAGAPEGTAPFPINTYYVSKMTDRNGNTMSFTYVPTGVKTVSTSDGRSVTFDYYANGMLRTVTDGARTWTYIYQAATDIANTYYLTEVQRPDGTSWKYEYHLTPFGTAGSTSLKTVTYPGGGKASYTYDFVNFSSNPDIPTSTVVKQKVATPGGTWNWAYTPATGAIVANEEGTFNFSIPPTAEQAPQVDQTAVTGPDDSKTYYHVGYNSAYSGITYLIGSLLGSSSPVQNEAFSTAAMVISDQTNIRPGGTLVYDGATATPLITFHTIGRSGESFSTTYDNFDGFGNPQTITETGSDTRVTNVTYHTDPNKWIIRLRKNETVTAGSETLAVTRSFDSKANLTAETRAGVITSFTYTSEGDVFSRTDARNKTTTYSDYFRGIARTESQPEGITLTRIVSNAGNVTSQTDGEMATTGFNYDGLNRVTGITHPLGNPVSVVWGPTTRRVTRGSYRQITTYDGFGREVGVQHTDTALGDSIVQDFRVDSLGRRVFASYLNAPIGTRFSYDMLNRLRSAFNEYNPSTGDWSNYRTKDYFSYKVRLIDERSNGYQYGYRSYGDPDKSELTSIMTSMDAASPSTTISRNIAGQINSVTQDGVTRTYGYDDRFFLTSIAEPETGTTVFGRDAVGNMISRQVGIAGQTTFTYDDRNRLTTTTYPSGTPGVITTYFKDDKPKSVDNGLARRDYVYDANKNLARETLTVGTKTFLTQYAHDSNDAITTLTYGSGKTIAYAPDAFGRPRQAGPYVTSIAYHPTGQPNSLTYANGVQTTVGINARQWPSSLQVTKGGALFNMGYLYDAVGNVTHVGDTVDSSYNRDMTYDPLDRLTGITGPWGSGSIGYDLRGNITKQNFGTYGLVYSYDAGTQRLASVSGSKVYAMNYDVYGNVIGNGTNSFSYNDASNMRCAKCGQPDEILFDYDGSNQRVRLNKGGAETYFVYGHGGQLLWEETPNSTLKEYIYLGGKQVATREQRLH